MKVDRNTLDELRDISLDFPHPDFTLTHKNELLIEQFDDPRVRRRFFTAPRKIWREAIRITKPNRLLLGKAQAAFGIELLMYFALRLGNLVDLEFGRHIDLDNRGRAILQIPAEETKDGKPIAFDIPTSLAKNLKIYRDTIAPSVIGNVPRFLFCNTDGSRKHIASVRYLIQRYMKMYVGLHMYPHAFRHLAAKFILDESPGAYGVVQQLLGHTDDATALRHYTGTNVGRAASHHRSLVVKALKASPSRAGLSSKQTRV